MGHSTSWQLFCDAKLPGSNLEKLDTISTQDLQAPRDGKGHQDDFGTLIYERKAVLFLACFPTLTAKTHSIIIVLLWIVDHG